jgi:aminoglycoside phosphotransferase (APT) family kinase protein
VAQAARRFGPTARAPACPLRHDAGVVERRFAVIESSAAPVIAELLRGVISRSELVAGGRTHTLRRVELADGRVLGVKQYVRGRDYAVEGAALRELDRAVPVPAITCTLDRVIAYRWIEGETLAECARRDPSALARLAAPLGALVGVLAQIARDAAPVDIEPASALLGRGPARERLGDPLADALRRRLDAARFDDPACLVHGDLDPRNIIVAASDQGPVIAGVVNWDAATAGSILTDVGRMFRHAAHHDVAFRAGFERGHGRLPVDWFRRARLLDATLLVAMLADGGDVPALRQLIASVVDEA